MTDVYQLAAFAVVFAAGWMAGEARMGWWFIVRLTMPQPVPRFTPYHGERHAWSGMVLAILAGALMAGVATWMI